MMPGASSLTKNISGPSHLDLSTIGRLPWGIARALFVVAALLSAVAFGLSRWALKLALVQRGSHELTRTPLFFAFAGLGHGQHLPSAGRWLAMTPCECRWATSEKPQSSLSWHTESMQRGTPSLLQAGLHESNAHSGPVAGAPHSSA